MRRPTKCRSTIIRKSPVNFAKQSETCVARRDKKVEAKHAMSEILKITDLHVATPEGKEILKGVNLEIKRGEVHALMGPNGSGKSTLGYAIMGHPGYVVTKGTITLDGQDVLAMEPNQRARAGIFLAFQRPMSIPGVKMADFLRHAATNVRRPNRKEGEELIPMRDFRKELNEKNGTVADG